jgi:hypothetical protein
MVGFIEPLGTTIQSAYEERNASIKPRNNSVLRCSRINLPTRRIKFMA